MHSAQHLWVETRKPDGQFEQRNVDDCSLCVFVFDSRGNELKPQVSDITDRSRIASCAVQRANGLAVVESAFLGFSFSLALALAYLKLGLS